MLTKKLWAAVIPHPAQLKLGKNAELYAAHKLLCKHILESYCRQQNKRTYGSPVVCSNRFQDSAS